jgi:hypothetical protein
MPAPNFVYDPAVPFSQLESITDIFSDISVSTETHCIWMPRCYIRLVRCCVNGTFSVADKTFTFTNVANSIGNGVVVIPASGSAAGIFAGSYFQPPYNYFDGTTYLKIVSSGGVTGAMRVVITIQGEEAGHGN